MLISEIKLNPNNPRIIKNDKFAKLVQSIKDFPQMLEKRPIVIDENNIVLGGNMRLKACLKAGMKDVPVIIASDWTDAQKKQFIIKDNVGFGEWDFEVLTNDWKDCDLSGWGLDLPKNQDENIYTQKITTPIYETKNKKPDIQKLYEDKKYRELLEEIETSEITPDEKEFLKIAAARHIVFFYDKIADYYAKSEKKTQCLMESSAMVIIDFDKAIENGYVKLAENIGKQYKGDYE